MATGLGVLLKRGVDPAVEAGTDQAIPLMCSAREHGEREYPIIYAEVHRRYALAPHLAYHNL